MLHAERLTRLLADEQIAEVLLEQAKKHPERRPLLERYLERAEPRARFLHDEITSTGARLLAKLAGTSVGEEARRAATAGRLRPAPRRARAAPRRRGSRRGRRVARWPCPAQHLRHQGRVLAALGGTALEAGLRAAGAGPGRVGARRSAAPGPEIVAEVPAPSRGAGARLPALRRRRSRGLQGPGAGAPVSPLGLPAGGADAARAALPADAGDERRLPAADERAAAGRGSRCGCGRGWRASTTTAGGRCCASG